MVKRGPNVIGLAAMILIYWGGLFYWIKDDLTSGVAEEQFRAAILFFVSFPYVGMVMWGTMTDLPEKLKELPLIGRFFKPFLWLVVVLLMAYWGWVDKAAVGFLLVGIALFGLGTGLAMSCLLYSGEESSRLYGLKRLVDVYPSITKPEAMSGSIRSFGQPPLF